jgi:hypothetical protein
MTVSMSASSSLYSFKSAGVTIDTADIVERFRPEEQDARVTTPSYRYGYQTKEILPERGPDAVSARADDSNADTSWTSPTFIF